MHPPDIDAVLKQARFEPFLPHPTLERLECERYSSSYVMHLPIATLRPGCLPALVPPAPDVAGGRIDPVERRYSNRLSDGPSTKYSSRIVDAVSAIGQYWPNMKSTRRNILKIDPMLKARALPLLSLLLLGCPCAYAHGNSSFPKVVTPLARVDLGSADDFVILTETGITDVPSSAITGNIGTSPITGAADLVTCAEVTGKVFSVDADGPAPCNIMDPSRLTTAVSDMQAAYTDAAGRTPTTINLNNGEIGGLTLQPGVYNWTSGVDIGSNLKLQGVKSGAHGVWIFQVNGDLNVAGGASVLLTKMAQTGNVFWQVTGQTILGTSAHLEGMVLSKTAIDLGTNASVNGRLYSQTAASLQMNTITSP